MMSYAYYVEDKPIATDATFDEITKTMLKNYDKIEHHHKHLIDYDSLKAGTYLGTYPTIVKDTVKMVRDKFLTNRFEPNIVFCCYFRKVFLVVDNIFKYAIIIIV